MRRTRKWLIWIFSIILALFVILFIIASVYINSFKPDLQEILSNNIGLETQIDGNIALKVTPGISFIANDIKVLSNETYVLKIKKAEISVDYIDLLNSNIDIRALKLTEPQVYVVRDPEGNFNFDGDRIMEPPVKGEKEMHDINLSRLDIEQGRLLYINHEYGDTLLVDGIDLKSDQIGVSGSLSSIEVDNIMFNGIVGIDLFKINQLKGDSLNFKIDGRGGKMAIIPLDNSYYGGKSNGKAILDFTKNPVHLQIQHQITGFDMRMFGNTIYDEEIFNGFLNYKLDISFSSFNWMQAKRSLNGSVEIDGENILLRGIDIDKVLNRFEKSQHFNVVDIGAFFVVGPYGAVFTKGINFAQLLSSNMGDSTTISTMVSKWTISKGKAKATDVAMRSDKYRIAMTGRLDLVNSAYNNVRISLLNTEGCAALSQEINGPFVDPETSSINSIGTISGPISNLWKDLTRPLRRPCTPVYRGSVKHPD